MDNSRNIPPLNIPALLRQFDLHPKKSLGQNFLTDPAALSTITAAGEISKADTVLEIGPGLGSLTRYLAVSAREVVAVELDARLIAPLEQILGAYGNVRLVQGDIMALRLASLIAVAGYLVVANIPYYLTSALIRHLLEAEQSPSRMVLTVQREVAERICAEPGEMSLLALGVQVYGYPYIVARIPAGAFYPAPKVDSAVLRVDLYPEPLIAAEVLDQFFRLAKAGFSQKRKTLRNALSGGMRWSKQQAQALLEAADIDPRRRAETLGMGEWRQLVEALGAEG